MKQHISYLSIVPVKIHFAILKLLCQSIIKRLRNEREFVALVCSLINERAI